MTTRVFSNAAIATMPPGGGYGLITSGFVAVTDGRIAFVGPELAGDYAGAQQEDMQGRLITPALVDCHTHLVFGGNRAREFEMRLNGAGYQEIARAGGGIVATVSATRAASHEDLVTSALRRLDTLIGEGVGLVEIKSGYGLDLETELQMLRVARELETRRDVRVRTSYLGAHAVPADYAGQADAYLDKVCLPALRAAHSEGLVDAVDGFCEGIAFDTSQMARVFDVAHELGLPVKLHAEQLSHIGGTALAARYGALSADHIEYATPGDAAALARAGTVAVLLPGAFYTLRETQMPPVAALRAHAVPLALASDCNPGSSPLTSLLLTMNMGCTLFGLTPAEALAGVTSQAARALGVADAGSVAVGLRADLAIWDVEEPAELAYRVGFNPLHRRIIGGRG